MHVARIRSGYTDKEGQRRDYESRYLRRTYRDGGKVRHETLANLSGLPETMIDSIEAALKGTALVPAARAVTILRSLPHGHVAAVHAMAVKLGLPALLGPACPERDLALALIISRVVAPASKLSTLTWWDDTTLGADLGAATVSAGRIYAAMDWLEHRQDAIEAKLARRHLAPDANPSQMALFDLSIFLAGRTPLPAGRPRLLPGRQERETADRVRAAHRPGRPPVAVRVFPGNTGDPGAFTEIVTVVRDKFGLAKMVMVGDRGMITSARIQAMNQAGDGTRRPDADTYQWITALRAPAIRKLMADDGPLQLSLFDQQDLAEITSPDFPGERLIACRNPVPGRRPRPHPRGTPGRHREAARPAHRPRPVRPPARRRADRRRGRQGDHQVQDRQALHRHHHRYQPDRHPQARPDRRRSRPRRVLRAPHPRPAQRARQRPPWSPPTRTSNTSNGTSATSNPTTWTCGPSSTGSKNASRPTC